MGSNVCGTHLSSRCLCQFGLWGTGAIKELDVQEVYWRRCLGRGRGRGRGRRSRSRCVFGEGSHQTDMQVWPLWQERGTEDLLGGASQYRAALFQHWPTWTPRARLTVEESHSEQEWPESNTPASAGTSRWVHRCHCWRLSPEYMYHRKFFWRHIWAVHLHPPRGL